jgi:hypothetical protein
MASDWRAYRRPALLADASRRTTGRAFSRRRPKRRTQQRRNARARAHGASFVGSSSAGSRSNQLNGFERLGLDRNTLPFIDRKKTPTARTSFVGEIAIPKSSPWAADDSIEIDADRVW